MSKSKIAIITCAAAIAVASCTQNDSHDDSWSCSGETLYQVGTLKGLLDGGYDGTVRVQELKRYGNSGVGTFDRIDGEMVVLNDTVYQCLWDGTVQIADDRTTVPFADVTVLDADTSFIISASENIQSLSEALDMHIDKNKMYIAALAGEYNNIKVRSELPQKKKPYKPLAEVMKTDQRFFTYEDIRGTLVALYTPDSMAEDTGSGWHFHFISDDRKKGGHVLELSAKEQTVSLDETPYFETIK